MPPLDLPDLTTDDLPSPSGFSAFRPFLKGVFSQWHPTPFHLHGLSFANAEQWMMYGKAQLFGDAARARAILSTGDPSEQKRLGQIVEGFDQAVWDRWKVALVYRGSRAKFEQNDGARRQLLVTAPDMLVEANPRDWVWGCGLSADQPGIQTPSAWLGENLLGRILTRLRADLL